MASPRVGIVDSSANIRETIAIVLGDEYAVRGVAPDAYGSNPSLLADVDLLIIEPGVLRPEAVAALIHGPPVLWLGDSSGGGDASQTVLSREFTPSVLRERVATLLARAREGRSPAATMQVVEYPFQTHDVAVLVRRAANSDLPVLICGEPGTGKARLARALHSISRDSRFVSVPSDGFTRRALQDFSEPSGDLTAFIDHVECVDRVGQQFLLELLDRGGLTRPGSWQRVRLICATSQTFEALGRVHDFDRELYYRLSVFPIHLPPLRERAADVPALADTLAGHITRQLAVPSVSFTPRAIERLSRYLWFGNIAELETVLARSIALASSRTIDIEDLLFGYGRLVRPAGAPAARAAGTRPDPPQTGSVDLIINELAHEFKNPMVTIKTISQHLERLLADQAGRQQVAQLTGEAVDRMDRALENMLQFTRFRQPTPHRIPLNTLLAPCPSEIAPLLSERHIVLNYQPPEALAVYVDPEQVTYAIENLLRAVVRDLEEGETITIRPLGQAAGFTVDFNGAHPLADKLACFLDMSPVTEEPALPLGVVFAKTLIGRNEGSLTVRAGSGHAVITIQLPVREGIAAPNGKTANSHS